jgi:hypothetical protein
MSDRVDHLHAELAALLALHEPGLTDGERSELLRLEEHSEWRPGRRPTRPEPKVRDFLDLFDRAEQEELTYRSLPDGSVDRLRLAFRERLSPG